MSVRREQANEERGQLSGLAYGVHIRGDLPFGFRHYLWPLAKQPSAPPRRLAVSYRFLPRLPPVEEIWVGEPGPGTDEHFALFREPGGVGLKVCGEGSGLFRLGPDQIAIEWLPGGSSAAHYFFSYALPLWLEQHGVPVLHASAVRLGDRAVAFVGRTGSGKSTLCAGLVRSGCGFLADDGLPLYEGSGGDWRCAAGPPLFKLWPSALEERLGVAAAGLPRIHESREKRLLPGSGEAAATSGVAPPASRLGLLYLLDRRPAGAGSVPSLPCSARESVIRLIEHSLAGGPVAALGLAARRLEQLDRLVSRTPVRRLRYPSGGEDWERLCRAIERDLVAAEGAGSA